MINNNKVTKKKKKRPFNVVDVLISLFILLFLSYIVYVLILGNSLYNIGAKRVAIEYEIEIDDADINLQNYKKINIGDTVKSNDGKEILGKVTYKYSINDGSVRVVISSDAFLRGDVYKIGDTEVYKNADINVRFPNYAPPVAVKCISIKVV